MNVSSFILAEIMRLFQIVLIRKKTERKTSVKIECECIEYSELIFYIISIFCDA